MPTNVAFSARGCFRSIAIASLGGQAVTGIDLGIAGAPVDYPDLGMRLGFLTACMPRAELPDIAWAEGAGYDIEVAVWPRSAIATSSAGRIDTAGLGQAARTSSWRSSREQASDVVARLLRQQPASRSGGAPGDQRPRHSRGGRAPRLPERRHVDRPRPRGRPSPRTWPRRRASSSRWLTTRVSAALPRSSSRLPMEGWHPDGYPGNLAYSPELWEWMFSLGLGLNYDPSCPVARRRPGGRAAPVCPTGSSTPTPRTPRCSPSGADRYSFFGVERTDELQRAGGHQEYRGSARSTGAASSTRSTKAGSTASVEHEDPVWGGNKDRVKAGLEVAHRTLRRCSSRPVGLRRRVDPAGVAAGPAKWTWR